MSARRLLELGRRVPLSGNVTTLQWVGAKSPRALEQSLGYQLGRLSAGYWIALLVQPLVPEDFEFDGLTLRSGGRTGLPAGSRHDDKLRQRVHDEVLDRIGAAAYRDRQLQALRSVKIRGPERLVKVVPITPHDSIASPEGQYPPGEGGLQWRIRERTEPEQAPEFLLGARIDADGIAAIASDLSFARVDRHAPYDDRAKLFRFLASA